MSRCLLSKFTFVSFKNKSMLKIHYFKTAGWDKNPAVEVIATMININYDHNMELLNACRPLHDYSYFICKIREYQEMDYTFDEAVELAVDYCIEHDVLRDILEMHKGEVKKMLLTEYDSKTHMKMEREEAHAEGHAEGEVEERDRINSLNLKLAEQGRADDIVKAARDVKYQKKLMREFGIISGEGDKK